MTDRIVFIRRCPTLAIGELQKLITWTLWRRTQR